MTDRYLWDGSGEKDPEVARLEALLSRFRYDRPAPGVPIASAPVRWRTAALAGAAALLLAAGSFFLAARLERGPAWEIESLAGSPLVNDRAIGTESDARLAAGDWLATEDGARARLTVADIGHVTVEEDSRLRLLASNPKEHRIELARGRIRASILAPPRLFFVETPAATAVDLGCAYTLDVDESGAGSLHVTFGWVSFERGGRESIVPRDGRCETRPGVGPGTPWFDDASAAFRVALEALDFGGGPGAGEGALDTILAEARPRDTLTLWHLLARVGDADRDRVLGRIVALVPECGRLPREPLLALEAAALGKLRSACEDAWY